MRNIFSSNIRLKLLALAFASALWFFVAGQSKTEIGFFVPIGFKGMPEDMVVASAPQAEVEVRVAGPKLFINNLSPSQIIAEVDLSRAKEGVNSYRLLASDVVTPTGIEVLRLRPASIDVRMERLIRVTLPVKLKVSGRPASGYRIASYQLSPRVVSASGTKKEIKELEAVFTRPVDIGGLKSPARFTVPLDLSGHEFRTISDDKVDIRLEIEKER